VLEAIVLAGGLGTRLGSIVSDVPKPLAPINGKPFLDILMQYWIRQGVKHFVLSIGYQADKILSRYGDSFEGCKISYVREDIPMGTGGGLLLATEKLIDDSDCLVLNGDTFFDIEFTKMIKIHKMKNADITFNLFWTDYESRFMGVNVNESGIIHSLNNGENKQARYVNGGVYFVKQKLLSDLKQQFPEPCSFENDLAPKITNSDAIVCGCIHDSFFIDIGVPEDYRKAVIRLEEYS